MIFKVNFPPEGAIEQAVDFFSRLGHGWQVMPHVSGSWSVFFTKRLVAGPAKFIVALALLFCSFLWAMVADFSIASMVLMVCAAIAAVLLMRSGMRTPRFQDISVSAKPIARKKILTLDCPEGMVPIEQPMGQVEATRVIVGYSAGALEVAQFLISRICTIAEEPSTSPVTTPVETLATEEVEGLVPANV